MPTAITVTHQVHHSLHITPFDKLLHPMSPRLPCDQVPVRTVFTVVEAGETKSLFADTLETSLQVKP